MLARHLLFFAARRPHSASLAVPKDTLPQDGSCQQPPLPPPYVEPPEIKNRKILRDARIIPGSYAKPTSNVANARQSEKVNKTNYKNNEDVAENGVDSKENRIVRGNGTRISNNGREIVTRDNKNVRQQRQTTTYFDGRENNVRNFTNDREREFYTQRNNDQQFYTLPSHKAPRDVEPPRSVTPDITRGLYRAPLSPVHMMARPGQSFNNRATIKLPSDENLQASENLNKNKEKTPSQDQQHQTSSVLRNRFIVPASLAAVGYRFVAAPTLVAPTSLSQDCLKSAGLSPIGPRNSGGFHSSTPGSVAATKTADNASSGRTTPTNLMLSPIKSTMSNEELFAAIHKSKRRLNIREDNEPVFTNEPGSARREENDGTSSRHSWSPESQKTPVVPASVNPISTTSRLDFKRLLLQQSVKSGPTKLSAAEQLKLSRQQSQSQSRSQKNLSNDQEHNQHLKIGQPPAPVKVLSPRSVWRFQSPRSDVLSSTIIEDSAAEEKAMKPSPENPSPISRMNSKRQLNLISSPELKLNVPNSSIIRDYYKTRNDGAEVDVVDGFDIGVGNANEKTVKISTNTSDFIENRRINNQIARAQFLASFPATVVPPASDRGKSNYFVRHNRARSESPQHSLTQNVSRSPSAPTLETAL